MRTPQRQRGAALLIALLTVALAALLASELLVVSQRDLARTRLLVESARAGQLAAGLDGLAREWIRRQREAGPDRASDGRWSETFPVPGGFVRGRVFDLSGRFNLNALAAADPDQRRAAAAGFAALAADLGLARETIDAILALYRPGPAGRILPLAHLSELDRIDGMTAVRRERLAGHVALLPDPQAKLNPNRATPQALAAHVAGLSPAQARAVLARAPFETLATLLDQPEFAGLPRAALEARVTLRSRWYLVQGQVVLDGEARDYFKLINASGNRYDFRYLSLGVP